MAASEPLPGMPIRPGDPGVFVCGPEDIAPWESAPVRTPANAGVGSAHKRAPRRVWLVLATCPACRKRGSYCADHDSRNWWITVSGLGRGRPRTPEKENAPAEPGVDTGSSDA